MTRLAAAAGMAVALHGLLLLAGGEWLTTGRPAGDRPRPVTIRLLEPRCEHAHEASPTSEENAASKDPLSVHAKRPAVRFSPPPSPAALQRRKTARRAPVPPRVLSPGSIPAEVPDIPEGAPEPSASIPQNPPPESSPASVPPETRTGDARAASTPDAAGDAGLEAPAPLVKEAVPLYRENPSPGYPRIARRRGYEGTVVLGVLVNEDGRVGEIRVAESSGHDMLDKAALRAVEDWRFEPGSRGGRAVSMRVLIPVCFRLQ